MLSDMKVMLMEKPECIVELLNKYDFCHIHMKQNEIRFARNESGGQNISIKLTNNENIYVKDFVTSDSSDIVGYIMKSRDVSFKDVVSDIKGILKIEDTYVKKTPFFGGFYNFSRKDSEVDITTYPETIMDQYEYAGNKRWKRDGISIITQKKYGVRYDKEEDLIVFPWRSASNGQIMAVKARTNYTPEEGKPKYFYVKQGNVSLSLYNYTENYEYLSKNGIVYVFESEKSSMLMDQFGDIYRDCEGYKSSVSLGSHNLSDTQAKLLVSLNPSEIWFMMDKGLDIKETIKNIETLNKYLLMKEIKIKYWDWSKNTSLNDKDAPVDGGKKIFDNICNKEMVEYKREVRS